MCLQVLGMLYNFWGTVHFLFLKLSVHKADVYRSWLSGFSSGTSELVEKSLQAGLEWRECD